MNKVQENKQETDLNSSFTVPERTLYVADVLKQNLLVLTGVSDDGEWHMAVVDKSSKYNDELIWALKSLGCKVVSCTK